MSSSSLAVSPGGKSLAAFHEERASLYSAIVILLGGATDGLDRSQLRRRLGRNHAAQPRARALVERVLTDPGVGEACQVWSESVVGSASRDLEILGQVASQAGLCARALHDGDMAVAADLWDAQRRDLCGSPGAALRGFAADLVSHEAPQLAALGQALDILLEDDILLAKLGA